MDLLVLGGGGFLGYHAVASAVAAGHRVSVLSRGGEPPLDGVEALRGDRTGDLGALRGRRWDAVLDTFSEPDAVAATARLLSGEVGCYGYVSGMSVYAPDGPAVPDESAPVRRPGGADDVLQERSVAKLACEAAVREGFDGPVLVVRPGIMVGPRDPTDRFTWWPVRLARALTDPAARVVLAPGDPDRPVQYTDARDLAAWTVRMLAVGHSGTFNGVGPGRADRLREVLAGCLRAAAEHLEATGRDGVPTDEVELAWAPEDLLAAGLADVEEEERPLWFPEPQIPQAAVDSSAAAAAGLSFRSAADTAADTLRWAVDEGRADRLAAGLSPAREARLVRAARDRDGGGDGEGTRRARH